LRWFRDARALSSLALGRALALTLRFRLRLARRSPELMPARPAPAVSAPRCAAGPPPL